MAGNNFSPESLFLTNVKPDRFGRAGTDLYLTVGGNTVNGGQMDELYDDLYAFMSNNKLPDTYTWQDASDAAQATGGVPGTFVWGIDADDKVYLEWTGGPSTTFELSNGQDLGFGFSTATSVTVSAGVERVTAANDWTRGNIGPQNISITVLAGGSFAVLTFHTVQGVVELLRDNGIGDGLDVSPGTSLGDAMVTQGSYMYMYLSHDGKVVLVQNDIDSDAVWDSTLLRDYLGFTGSEVFVTNLVCKWITATYPPSGTLWHRRPLAYQEPVVKSYHSNPVTYADGRMERTAAFVQHGWDVAVDFEGDVKGQSRDNLLNAKDRFIEDLFDGDFFTVQPDKYERRLAVGVREDYGLGQTGEFDKRVGKLQLFLGSGQDELAFAPDSATARSLYNLTFRGWDYVPAAPVPAAPVPAAPAPE